MPKKTGLAQREEPTVKVSTRGVTRLEARHPWVYRSDIVEEKEIAPGSVVRVLDQRGKFLGTALYSSSSQIAIRMISHGSVDDLGALVAERIRAAIAYRKTFVSNANAYRVIFSEADFLPGLIVDRYDDVLTLQILTQAFDRASVRETVVQTLAEELHPEGIVERVDPRIRELEQLPARESGLVRGEKSSTVIRMNGETTTIGDDAAGVRFHYDAFEGQKTGAFLDQRENYAAAAQYAHGEALDTFCYQGGFALHLARKCENLTGVDSSRPALEMAEKNALLNGREVEWIEANAFDLLRDYAAANRRYDTIVLDPPAFAKTKRDLDKALRGYKELNLRAMKMLRPGGILITCSCSFHVGAQDFAKVLSEAAQDAHKSMRVVESRGAAKDHPALLNVAETSYLQCIILTASN